jgi:hypothetical protein
MLGVTPHRTCVTTGILIKEIYGMVVNAAVGKGCYSQDVGSAFISRCVSMFLARQQGWTGQRPGATCLVLFQSFISFNILQAVLGSLELIGSLCCPS